MKKRTIAVLLSISILLQAFPIHSIADNSSNVNSNTTDQTKQQHEDDNNAIISSLMKTQRKNVSDLIEQVKNSALSYGYGFAVERDNNLIDRVKGKNIRKERQNNINKEANQDILNRGGNKIIIQNKYYMSALDGINACLDDKGNYKFINSEGKPMSIEVPSDQHYSAFKNMQRIISEGRVKGSSDPQDAVWLVKKGNLTYDQVKILAISGLVDSLTYDERTGIISTDNSLGISIVINNAIGSIHGKNKEERIRVIGNEGFNTGEDIFGTFDLTGTFSPSEKTLVSKFGEEITEEIMQELGENAIKKVTKDSAKSITKQTAKGMKSIISKASPAIIELIDIAPDVKNLFEMRISKEELSKVLLTSGGSIAGGAVGKGLGAAIGSFFSPLGIAIGEKTGEILLASTGGVLANKAADKYIPSDAEKMYKILISSFVKKCEDYTLTESEAQNIITKLEPKLKDDFFMDMYQADNGGDGIDHFLNDLFDPLFESEIRKRKSIESLTEDEIRSSLKQEKKDLIYIH